MPASESKVPAPETAPGDAFVPLSLITRIITLATVLLPLVGIIAAVILLWGIGFSWVQLGIFLGMYFATSVGVTVGFHRLFTHRSFETSAPVRFIFGALGSMAVEGPLFEWVANHRRHHQHSDRPDDPHSPHGHGVGPLAMLRGIWRAHIGWFFEPEPADLERYIPDLAADRATRAASTLFPLWAVLSLIIPAALGGLFTLSWLGVLLGFIWGGLTRMFLVHHITWSINSVCHIWGSQPFDCHDESRNNPIFGVLALGEGWHNNHHAFPASARHGLRWWEFDASYWFIRGMEFCHLVRSVRVPSATRIDARRHR